MNEQSRKMELLGAAPMPKALLALGLPTMTGMLINALYTLADTYFVGGLGRWPFLWGRSWWAWGCFSGTARRHIFPGCWGAGTEIPRIR